MIRTIAVALMSLSFVPTPASAQEKKTDPAKDARWTLLSGAGEKLAVKNPRFLTGTRRLTWLADGGGKNAKGPADAGPECFEFRERNSTLYADGILTLVPVPAIAEIAYDEKGQTIRLTYRGPGGKESALQGTIKYKGINKCVVEADAGLKPFGAALVRFQGGLLEGGFAGLRLPGSETVAEEKGPAVVFLANDKENSEHQVVDPLPLYRATKVTGTKKELQVLKGDKAAAVPVADIAVLRHVPPKTKKDSPFRFELTLKDGTKENVLLLKDSPKGATPPWTFLGFVGRVAAGWKLLPAHTIRQATWPVMKKPAQ